MSKVQRISYCILLVFLIVACSGSPSSPTSISPESRSTAIDTAGDINERPNSSPTGTALVPVTGHLMEPASEVPSPAKVIDDVESSGTGAEGRAPYGDSYAINRFERPFSQDMTYIPDMDIHKFSLSQDADWYYVSIRLIGNNPNDPLGIDFGVEIDSDADGFGDYAIWANPTYTTAWDTSNVQIYQDADHDSAGASASQSDAVFDGNGYETLVFDGKGGENTDPDLAWVRMVEGEQAVIQFAFKRSLVGSFFALGVVSDAGLKDVSQYDYADAFSEQDAGSPVRDKQFFPLASVYAVDNTCWEPYGHNPTGFNSRKTCQQIIQPVNTDSADDNEAGQPSSACNPETCGDLPYDPITCECIFE